MVVILNDWNEIGRGSLQNLRLSLMGNGYDREFEGDGIRLRYS
jgi:hypothetical protein